MAGMAARRAAIAVLFTAILAVPVMAQDLDEVLARHYEAIGGADAWVNLQTIKASGTIAVSGGMLQGSFDLVQKRPAMSRSDIVLQGMTIVQAYDGETAWQINPFATGEEPVVAEPAAAQQIIEQADLDGPLIGWRESGHRIEFVGPTDLAGQPVLELLVTLANGTASHYYLGADSYLPVRIVSEVMGSETTTVFDDYRDVDGLKFPFSIEIDTPIGVQTLTFSSVEVNPAVDESVFSMSGG